MCELANSRVCSLNPVWDCRVSLNVGGYVLRPVMKYPPTLQSCASEAIFVFLRCKVRDSLVMVPPLIKYVNQGLKTLARSGRDSSRTEGTELAGLDQTIGEQYLQI